MTAFNRRVINLRNVQFVDGRLHELKQLIIFGSSLFLYTAYVHTQHYNSRVHSNTQ